MIFLIQWTEKSKLKNRLGTDKAAKLAFLFKSMNANTAHVEFLNLLMVKHYIYKIFS